MTTIKDMIQKMDQIEGSVKQTSVITEASLSINANAETAAEIGELMRVMQLGGVVHNDGSTSELPHMEPEASDCGCGQSPCGCGSDDEEVLALPAPEHDDREMMKRRMVALDNIDSDVDEDYANEPEEEYHSTDDLLASGDDLHKSKKMYAKAADGDNAMAVETIKSALMAALNEKKKPDADGDGVPDWADKKPGEDDNAEDDEEEK